MGETPMLRVMLKRVDRLIYRVPQLESAVRFYRDVMGLKLLKHTPQIASFQLSDDDTELILHSDPDQPDEAVYYLVEDVRELYRRRDELKLKFISPPAPASRGYRAAVRDPFDNLLLLLDRTLEKGASAAIEDGKAPGALFAGVEPKIAVKAEALTKIYEGIGRTADDLPYTPHFETLYSSYIGQIDDPKPSRQEVWRQLLNLRKGSKLPKLGPARSQPPEVSEEARQKLREMLGKDIGKRDRLPYTPRFDQIVNKFNEDQRRPLSPHLVWRLVATLAK